MTLTIPQAPGRAPVVARECRDVETDPFADMSTVDLIAELDRVVEASRQARTIAPDSLLSSGYGGAARVAVLCTANVNDLLAPAWRAGGAR